MTAIRSSRGSRFLSGLGLALLAAGALACVAPGLALAQRAPAQTKGDNFQVRLYINAFSRGDTDKSPQDPNGKSKSESFGNDGATLEAILYKRIGVSIAQDYVGRNYTDSTGNDIRERWVSTYYSLTGYLKETGASGWNLFLGASTGTVDRYSAEVNSQPSMNPNPIRNLPLTRYYGGVELAFSRIGFRAAYIQSEASDTVAGQKLELNQTLQVLSVFIPFG